MKITIKNLKKSIKQDLSIKIMNKKKQKESEKKKRKYCGIKFRYENRDLFC